MNLTFNRTKRMAILFLILKDLAIILWSRALRHSEGPINASLNSTRNACLSVYWTSHIISSCNFLLFILTSHLPASPFLSHYIFSSHISLPIVLTFTRCVIEMSKKHIIISYLLCQRSKTASLVAILSIWYWYLNAAKFDIASLSLVF